MLIVMPILTAEELSQRLTTFQYKPTASKALWISGNSPSFIAFLNTHEVLKGDENFTDLDAINRLEVQLKKRIASLNAFALIENCLQIDLLHHLVAAKDKEADIAQVLRTLNIDDSELDKESIVQCIKLAMSRIATLERRKRYVSIPELVKIVNEPLTFSLQYQPYFSQTQRDDVLLSLSEHFFGLKRENKLSLYNYENTMIWALHFADFTKKGQINCLIKLIFNSAHPHCDKTFYLEEVSIKRELFYQHLFKTCQWITEKFAGKPGIDRFIKKIFLKVLTEATTTDENTLKKLIATLSKPLQIQFAELALRFGYFNLVSDVYRAHNQALPQCEVLAFYHDEEVASQDFLQVACHLQAVIVSMQHPLSHHAKLLNSYTVPLTQISEKVAAMTKEQMAFLLQHYGQAMLEAKSASFFQTIAEKHADLIGPFSAGLNDSDKQSLNAFLSMSADEAVNHDTILHQFLSGGRLEMDEGLLFALITHEKTSSRPRGQYDFEPVFVTKDGCRSPSKLGVKTWTEDDVVALMTRLSQHPEQLAEGRHITLVFPGDHWLTVCISQTKGVIDFTVFNSTNSATLDIESLHDKLMALEHIRINTTMEHRLRAYIGCSYFALYDAKLIARMETLFHGRMSDYLAEIGLKQDYSTHSFSHYPYIFQRYMQSKCLFEDYAKARQSESSSYQDYQAYRKRKAQKPHHPKDKFEQQTGLDGESRQVNTSITSKLSRSRAMLSYYLRKHPEYLRPLDGLALLKQRLQQYNDQCIKSTQSLLTPPVALSLR